MTEDRLLLFCQVMGERTQEEQELIESTEEAMMHEDWDCGACTGTGTTWTMTYNNPRKILTCENCLGTGKVRIPKDICRDLLKNNKS